MRASNGIWFAYSPDSAISHLPDDLGGIGILNDMFPNFGDYFIKGYLISFSQLDREKEIFSIFVYPFYAIFIHHKCSQYLSRIDHLNNLSCPSGHAAGIFAFLTVLAAGAILIISGLVPSIMAMDIVRSSYLIDLHLELDHHLGYAVQYDPGHGQK